MDKKAMSNTNKLIAFGVIALLAISVVALFGENIKNAVSGQKLVVEESQGTTLKETGEPVTSTATVSCPNDKNVDGKARYLDGLSTNRDKVANIVSFMVPVGRTDVTRVTLGNSTATGDGFSTAVNVPCDADTPILYEPTAVTKKWGAVSAYGFQSAVNPQVVAGKSDRVEVTFEGKRQDWIKLKVLDNQQSASLEQLININVSDTTNSTGFNAINVDDGTTSGSPDAAGVPFEANVGGAITVNADEYLDLTIKLKTNNTKSQFGEDGLRTFMVVDAAKSKWDIPVVSGQGATNVEISGSNFNVDDASMLSNYEYAYTINPIKETESTISFYIKTASGVNPGASDDVCILFAPEGRYDSVEKLDTVRTSIYEDSSSNLQVAFNQAQKLCINVA